MSYSKGFSARDFSRVSIWRSSVASSSSEEEEERGELGFPFSGSSRDFSIPAYNQPSLLRQRRLSLSSPSVSLSLSTAANLEQRKSAIYQRSFCILIPNNTSWFQHFRKCIQFLCYFCFSLIYVKQFLFSFFSS